MRPCSLIPSLHAIKNPFLIRLIVKLADNNNSITFLNALERAKSNSNHFNFIIRQTDWAHYTLVTCRKPGVELQCLDSTKTIVPDNSPLPLQGDSAACHLPCQEARLCQDAEEMVCLSAHVCKQVCLSSGKHIHLPAKLRLHVRQHPAGIHNWQYIKEREREHPWYHSGKSIKRCITDTTVTIAENIRHKA